MGDYYQHFLSSMSGAGMNPVHTPDEMQPSMVTTGPMLMAGTPVSAPYTQLEYFSGYSGSIIYNAAKSQKGRRKAGAASGSGVDLVKHRRTRSGCFTCRSRRVKCDETRPVCERCKKGSRDCNYPDPPSSKSTSGSSSRQREATNAAAQQTSPPSSNDEDEDDIEHDVKLETIPDEDEPEEESRAESSSIGSSRMTNLSMQHSSWRQTSETPSYDSAKESSPSISTTTPNSITATAYPSADFPLSRGERPDWSHLPPEFQRCLSYFVEHMTHYQYCLPGDADNFFKTILPDIAIRNEPLLSALVGFVSYHMTLQNPSGKLEDFLKYYNRSVTLLLTFLKRKEKHNVATLLTILQLATIEEYLGDWVNLMGHQKAALEIITKIFTPQTIMQTPLGRMCLNWYVRFDIFVGLMGGFPADLPREWLIAMTGFYQAREAAQPDVLRFKMEHCSARLRFISYDMSILFSKGNRGQISDEQFIEEHDRLTERLVQWKEKMDPALTDAQYLVTEVGSMAFSKLGDIVAPFTPGILYDFPLFKTTLLCAEWNSITIMHKSQSSNMRPDILFAELRHYAYATCQYFQTLETWPATPKGVLVLVQACIAIACLFLPQDESHHMWFRRKFALLESMGYIHPLSLRSKMAEVFRDPECVRWWLPRDEGFSHVLQNIRSFADERNAAAVTAQQENLREVRHIFAKMSLTSA